MSGTTISNSSTVAVQLNSAAQNPVSITSSGTINAPGGYAISGAGIQTWQIANSGALTSTGNTILLGGGGSVTNGSKSTPTATIDGLNGIYIQHAAGTVTNFGTINGSSYGVALGAGGTVINAGTITGGGGYAVYLVGTAGVQSRLVVDPGAVFNGKVGASPAASNTLEFANLPKAGTLSGVGTSFTNFNTLQVDSGAHWTLSGNNSLAAGASVTLGSSSSLIVAGTLKAGSSFNITGGGSLSTASGLTVAKGGLLGLAGTIANSITDAGTLRATGGTLTVAGNLGGAGSVGIDTNSVLDVTGTLSVKMVNFLAGGGSTLDITHQPTPVHSSIKGFLNTDTIDLIGVIGTAASFATATMGGTLTVTGSGGSVATLSFSGSYASTAFTATSDQHGGTLIKLS